MSLDPINRYYFYQSAIGSLEEIVTRYVLPEIEPTPGFLTNAFGVKVNPDHLPYVIGGKEGVEPPPIPANWHADLAEFGSALRAVDLARDKFTVVELGCGWGCWLNITGVVAKRKGLDVMLIGVEGDAGHVEFAHQSLGENGFDDGEYVIHHGIASGRSGHALFPIQDQAGVSWGLEARFDVPGDKLAESLETGEYVQLDQIPLSSLLPDGRDRIDLLHVDIQGAEIPLIPSSMSFLNDKVAMALIGTHGKQIEAALFDCFQGAGWILEVERPAILAVGRDIHTLVDGVQLWRNPHLVPDKILPLFEPPDYAGKLEIVSIPASVSLGEGFFVDVTISNLSKKNWAGSGGHPVSISYHWHYEDGEIAVFDGMRTGLRNGVIEAETQVAQQVWVLAPSEPGRLRLEVTLVHEGISWFERHSFNSGDAGIVVQ